MHQFQEHHREFAGFSDYYRDVLRPRLLERDAARAEAHRKGVVVAAVVAGVAVVAGLVAVFGFSASLPVLLAAFGFGTLGSIGAYAALTAKVRGDAKLTMMEGVTEFIGWSFEADVPQFDLAPYETHFLIPGDHDRRMFEDRIVGKAHGAAFESVEATLQRRERDSDGDERWVTVFRGQLMRLDFPTRTFGRTVVLRDRGLFNRKRKADMKRIGLASPRFEKLFEAYGTDQVDARVILDPAFMQRMIDLEAAVSGKNIRFAFTDNDLLIAVDTQDQFKAGSMGRSLDNPEAVQTILDEVGVLYDIVDGLAQPATRITSQPR